MPNPRRGGLIESHALSSSLSHLMTLLKKPLAFPLLLSLFVFLTWLSLRLQRSAYAPAPPSKRIESGGSGGDEDNKANVVRFESALASLIRKDDRGWLLDPVTLARGSRIRGGAVSCVSVHVGEIRPGKMRGNHRHHACNETFVFWGAKTKFRVENNQVDKGFAEVIVGHDEVAVAASPRGTGHALLNVDSVRSTFFIGCQDCNIQTNSSNTDFHVWKDL